MSSSQSPCWRSVQSIQPYRKAYRHATTFGPMHDLCTVFMSIPLKWCCTRKGPCSNSTYYSALATMKSLLRSLAVATALFLLGLRALETKSEPGILPHSLEIRAEDTSFTPKEDQQLRELKEKYPRLTWPEIAKFFPDRSPSSVMQRYISYIKPNVGAPIRTFYTFEEDSLLVDLRAEGLTWPEIAETFAKYFPRRSAKALWARYDKYLMPAPGRSAYKPYTQVEDQCLIQLKEQGLEWDEIAESFEGRTAAGLRNRWDNNLKWKLGLKSKLTDFKPEEDQRLIELRGQGLNWDEIAESFEGRTASALKSRWHNTLKHNLGIEPTRTDFTPEEDQRLIQLKGQGLKWDEIAESFEGRTSSALQSRWHNHLKHDLGQERTKNTFTPKEDRLLIKLKGQGLKWDEITKSFDGRTIRSLESRWRRLLKPKTEPKTQETEDAPE